MRIIQAESEPKEKKSLKNSSSKKSRSGSPAPHHHGNASSDDGSVSAGESFNGSTPQKKNRGGYCFGTALFEVGDLLGSRNYTKVKRLKKGGVYVLQCDMWRAVVYLVFLLRTS